MSVKSQVVFISHGGGPMPLQDDPGHREMVSSLQALTEKLRRPRAIVVISAHWEAPVATLTAGAAPSLIYDYYGFPEQAYYIKYACPGLPTLADSLYKAFSAKKIAARKDEQRGFDHGVFVPLKIMYPHADIPCVQLSLLTSLDPLAHINMGKALAEVLAEDTLVIGSGFSFHNLGAFFTPETVSGRALNRDFENWLLETCGSRALTEAQREQRLSEWQHAPGARYCHPREEHLLPLLCCYGIAQAPCRESIELEILNKKSSMYLW